MATTYLTLTNRVLRELNETELTSSTFASSRGIQTAIKDFVNKSIHDIYNEASKIIEAAKTYDLKVIKKAISKYVTKYNSQYNTKEENKKKSFSGN